MNHKLPKINRTKISTEEKGQKTAAFIIIYSLDYGTTGALI